MKISEMNKRELVKSVTITLETVDELEWAYRAFSNAVHMQGVEEDSSQQKFYCSVHPVLNDLASRYR